MDGQRAGGATIGCNEGVSNKKLMKEQHNIQGRRLTSLVHDRHDARVVSATNLHHQSQQVMTSAA